jgi:hypothetical protein
MRLLTIPFASFLCFAASLPAQDEVKEKPADRRNLFPAAMYLARPDLDASLRLTEAQKASVTAGEELQLDEAQQARVARVRELHAQAVTSVTEQLGKRLGSGPVDDKLAARIAALLERKPEHLVPECRRLLEQEDAQSDEALLKELEKLHKPGTAGAEDKKPEPKPAAASAPPAKPASQPALLDGLLRAATDELSKTAGREVGKALGKEGETSGAGDLAEAATRALLEELLRKKAKKDGQR